MGRKGNSIVERKPNKPRDGERRGRGRPRKFELDIRVKKEHISQAIKWLLKPDNYRTRRVSNVELPCINSMNVFELARTISIPDTQRMNEELRLAVLRNDWTYCCNLLSIALESKLRTTDSAYIPIGTCAGLSILHSHSTEILEAFRNAMCNHTPTAFTKAEMKEQLEHFFENLFILTPQPKLMI